jgi:hopene-associated glycosyltransferase HpnB
MVLLWIGLAGWVLLFLRLAHNARGYRRVRAAQAFPLASRPRVSILIPARNEADILPVTLPAILAQDYPDYEAILVDDNSSDGTGELARQVAAMHPDRFRVIHVSELPPGWVGKTHALHVAFQAAQGDWVLATDADIVFHPKALEAGLWLAEQQNAELVSIYSFLECISFWEKVMLPGFGLLLSAFFPVRHINDPRNPLALASGGYILMRRSMWADLGGYLSICGEMIDDLNTARRVKRSGHRMYVAATQDLLRTRMYSDFGEIWEGLRKNAFAGHGFSVPKILATVMAYATGNLLPLACLLSYGWAWAGGSYGGSASILLLSTAQYALSVAMHLPMLVYLGIPLGYALLAPVGAIFYAGICVDSMLRTVLGRGVSWKSRHYGSSNGGEAKSAQPKRLPM